MTTRELIQLARNTLTPQELDVWLTKHIAGLGRRTGSRALGITETQWRYRLRNAHTKITAALATQKDAA